MTLKTSIVVLLARINDPVAQTTTAQFTAVVPVEHDAAESPAALAEMAMELAPAVEDWTRV